MAERADALEHRMMEELDVIIVKSRLFNLADADMEFVGGAALQAKHPGKKMLMGDDPRLIHWRSSAKAASLIVRELEARLLHLRFRAGHGSDPQLGSYGDVVLNFETYQAMIDDRPLDLTYMEYELLKFLAAHPGKVFTRETLLSRVWGYEYYGGARTVETTPPNPG